MVIKAKGSMRAKKKSPSVEDVVVIAPGEQTEPRDVVLYRSQAERKMILSVLMKITLCMTQQLIL